MQVPTQLTYTYYNLLYRIPVPPGDFIYSIPDGWLMLEIHWEESRGNGMEPGNRVIFTYDADGSASWLQHGPDQTCLEDTKKGSFRFDSNKHQVETKYESEDACNTNLFAYDEAGIKTGSLLKTWRDSTWVDSLMMMFAHDMNGRETAWLSMKWNDSEWVPSMTFLFSYDTKGRLIEKLVQYVGLVRSNWKNLSKYTYSYDSIGNRTELASKYDDVDGWVCHQMKSRLFDSEGRVTVEQFQTCGPQKVPELEITHVYGKNGIQDRTTSEWRNDKWYPKERMQVKYDEHGVPSQILRQEVQSGDWVDKSVAHITWRRAEGQ